MPSEWSGSDLAQRAKDALDSIEAVGSYVRGMTFEEYASDRKTQSAVERELLTVAEACAKIIDIDENVESRFPTVPWRSIRGMGNIIRHEYGRVEPKIVWDTIVGDDFASLARALKQLPHPE